MVTNSLIITDYMFPIHSAEKSENYPQIHKIQNIKNLWTNKYVLRAFQHKRVFPPSPLK